MGFGPSQGGGSGFTTIQAGGSSSFFPPLLMANVDFTSVGNVGAGEDNLITYSLPANALSANGKSVRFFGWGSIANNANAKTLKVYIGSTSVLSVSLTANQAGTWWIDAFCIRTGSNAQKYQVRMNQGGTTTILQMANGTLTETDTAAIVLKCTGTATTDNDIVQAAMVVYFGN